MANLKTLFATAPRIKLYIDDRPVAYAIGFNVNVSVDVQPIMILGQFAPVSLEPTMYNTVTGTIQIARLTSPGVLQKRAASADILKDGDTSQSSVASVTDAFGNEVSTRTDDAGNTITNSPLQQSSLFQHVDPTRVLLSSAVDMILYMKIPNPAGDGLIEVPWMAIQSCRITSRNTNIAMASIVNEPLNFQGLLALHQGEADKFTLDNAIRQVNG